MDPLADDNLTIEVAYATADRQRVVSLTVAPGTTLREAVRLSGITDAFPEIDAEQCPLGVWGTALDSDKVVCDGDRVEIYRELIHDPREARMRLARSGQTMGAARPQADHTDG